MRHAQPFAGSAARMNARRSEVIEWHVGPSPLGHMMYRAESEYLTGLFFVGQKHFPAGLPEPALSDTAPKSRAIAVAREQVAEYFAGERNLFDVALRLNGTAFQQQVWAQLRQIPFGEAWTYGDLARRLKLPAGASRAVGGANGRNPVCIIVPCHRVIGGDGDLTGYAGGVERKRHLLTLEGGRGREQLTLF
jgi:methylated-DNA-[protein]-cysteine S-methyltransferase